MRCSWVAVLVLAAGLLAGCSAPEAHPQTEPGPREAAADAAAQQAADEAEAAVEEIRTALEDRRLNVYELHETFAGVPAATQAEYAEHVERLGDLLRQADEQLAQLREAEDDAFDERRHKLQETLDRLDAAYQEIVDALAEL